jgi:hypothetical protein
VEKLEKIRLSLPYDGRLMSPEWAPGAPTLLRSLLGEDRTQIFDRVVRFSGNESQFEMAVKLKRLKALAIRLPQNPTQNQIDDLRRLRSLEILKLENNFADDESSKTIVLPKWQRLRMLDLTGVSNFYGDGLGRLTNLECLLLRHTQVSDEALAAVESMTHLTQLDLSNTSVTDGGLRHVAEATQLKSLILNDLPITDRGLERLRSLENLEELELCFTRISDDGIHHLKHLQSLRRLRLTQISREAMDELRTSLPECKIW